MGPGSTNSVLTYDMDKLEQRAEARICDVCALLQRTCEKRYNKLHLQRVGSNLRMNDRRGTPALSIRRSIGTLSVFSSLTYDEASMYLTDLDYNTPERNEIQIGSAQLPNASSAAHFEILRRWLQSCDAQTVPRKPVWSRASARMPMRLVDVGAEGDAKVYLWKTGPSYSGEWLTLSYTWGAHGFITTAANWPSHCNGVEVNELLTTIRDAITVTRALSHRYIWIECLCIVQDPEGDFSQEAKLIEQYISGANCIIAAVSAEDMNSGFLRERKRIDSFSFQSEDGVGSIHITQNIDDFEGHVLNSRLQQQGWTL